MDYSDEKAKAIIEKFNLSPTTAAVWRSRGSIPNKYAQHFKFIEDDRVLERLHKTLKSEKINLSVLAKSADFAGLHDFLAGRGKVKEDQYTRTKTVLNRVKIEGLKIVAEINKIRSVRESLTEDIRKFLKNNPEIKTSLVFEKRFLDFKAGKIQDLSREDYVFFADKMTIFAMEIQF